MLYNNVILIFVFVFIIVMLSILDSFFGIGISPRESNVNTDVRWLIALEFICVLLFGTLGLGS